LGTNAVPIALAAECAAQQGLFAEYHAAAYHRINVALTRGGWLRIAKTISGLDSEELKQCVDEKRTATPLIAQADFAVRLGVTATPTTLVNGRFISGLISLASLEMAIGSVMVTRGR
jgi:protein-disulfide isomerase